MGNKKISQPIFWTFTLVLLFMNWHNVFCITTGGSLVSKARQYKSPFHSYSDEQPPNLHYTGELKDSLYNYGYIWGSSSWNGTDEWTDGFDCSGFVSWCANLRRHFGTSEFTDFFGGEKTFETASEGDIIYWSGHVCIFIDYYYSETRSRWEVAVIHSADPPIQGGTSGVYEEFGAESYFNGHSAKVYPFKDDTTGPTITCTGIEDGGVYQTATLQDYTVSDGFIKGNYPKEKVFSTEGNYTLNLIGSDWAKNETNNTIHFTVDTTPPGVTGNNIIRVSRSATDPNLQPLTRNFEVRCSAKDPSPGSGLHTINAYLDGDNSPVYSHTFYSSDHVNSQEIMFWKTYTLQSNQINNGGWGVHAVKVVATDFAGNSTDYRYNLYICPPPTQSNYDKSYWGAAHDANGNWFSFPSTPDNTWTQEIIDYYNTSGNYNYSDPVGIAIGNGGVRYKAPITEWSRINNGVGQYASNWTLFAGDAQIGSPYIAFCGDFPAETINNITGNLVNGGQLTINVKARDLFNQTVWDFNSSSSYDLNSLLKSTQINIDKASLGSFYVAITLKSGAGATFGGIHMPIQTIVSPDQKSILSFASKKPHIAYSQGNMALYGIDKLNFQIKSFFESKDQSGNIIYNQSSPISTPQDVNPVDVVKYNGYYYVADNNRASIMKLNSNGSFVGEIGYGVLNSIGNMEINNNTGKIYVLEPFAGLVRVYDTSNDALVQTIGDGLNNPKDISLDAAGNIYVADTGNDRIVAYNNTGTQLFSIHDQMGDTVVTKAPEGVGVDAAGNVYVSLPDANSVYKYDVSGNRQTWASSSYSQSMHYPTGITTDITKGSVFIADWGNGRIVNCPDLNGMTPPAISAIDSGLDWLRDQQNSDGSWGGEDEDTYSLKGPATYLALLALMNNGADPLNDSRVINGLIFLISHQNLAFPFDVSYGRFDLGDEEWNATYAQSCAISAIMAAKRVSKSDKWDQNILSGLTWLQARQVPSGICTGGWGDSYAGENYIDLGLVDVMSADIQNTLYSVIALKEGEELFPGFSWPQESKQSAISFIKRCRNNAADHFNLTYPTILQEDLNGYKLFPFYPDSGEHSYGRYTVAAMLALYCCGYSDDNTTHYLESAVSWLNSNDTIFASEDPGFAGSYAGRDKQYYDYIFNLTRAFIFQNIKENPAASINLKNWDTSVASALTASQNTSGSWPKSNPGMWSDTEICNTEFAILSLQNAQQAFGGSTSFNLATEADLHIYDSQNRHVGLNSGGSPEIQIPNALFNVTTVNGERKTTITLPTLNGEKYQVQVVATDLSETYHLTTTGSFFGQQFITNLQVKDINPGETQTFQVRFGSLIGTKDITIKPNFSQSPEEFVCLIKESGGDYTSLSAWQTAIRCDLNSTTLFKHSGINGVIPDGATVSGTISGSTGTVVHATATQILLRNTTGLFSYGEKIYYQNLNTNFVTITNAGSPAIAAAKIDGIWANPETNNISIDGNWITSANSYIRIYTAPQARHNGKWSNTAFRLSPATEWQPALKINADYVRIDGLQIENRSTGNPDGIQYYGNGEFQCSNNIIHDTRWGVVVSTYSAATVKIWNNIVYDFTSNGIRRYNGDGDLGTSIIYNNTLYTNNANTNNTVGIYLQNSANVYLKNNLVQVGATPTMLEYDLISNGSQITSNNISEDSSSPNSALRNKSIVFKNEPNSNFLLSAIDNIARNAGIDLSNDPYLAFNTDIIGNTRPFGSDWDIGANEMTDNLAPSGITNLTAEIGKDSGELDLKWTASGNDGTTDPLLTGSQYKIQYSNDTNVFWSTGSAQITISTENVNPGDWQYWTINNLSPGTYNIRIWTKDETGNWSIASSPIACYIGPREIASKIKEAGGDYLSLSAWVNAVKCDIATSTGTRVFNHNGIMGSISRGSTVFGLISGSTGTVISINPSQVLISNIDGKFTKYEKVYYQNPEINYLTIADYGTRTIESAQIEGSWTNADTTNVEIPKSWTTSQDSYIRIYTTDSSKHTGKWTSTGYILSPATSWKPAIKVLADYVRIEGLQMENRATGNPDGIQFTGAGELRCSNNIIKNTRYGINVNENSTSGSTAKIFNNIIYDFNSNGIRSYHSSNIGTSVVIYNNTLYTNVASTSYTVGIYAQNNANVQLKNNIVQFGATPMALNYDLIGNSNQITANNISEDNSSPNGANYRNKTVSFEDESNNSFLLVKADMTAKDGGVDLSNNQYLAFNYDITGDARPIGNAWDIGADEMLDHSAPSAITDASALTGINAGELIVSWSAPGNDGQTGSITGGLYKINYSTSPADQLSYTNAQITISTSCNPGQQQSHILAGLIVEGTYYIKIWASDELSNWSEASNTATAWADTEGGMGMFSQKKYSGPDPAFKLGDVYAYPNPAKGGYKPTIHVEVGMADSVNLKIYNIAAELVHMADITDTLTTVNNKYAYEYQWNANTMASGVYIYYVNAQKSGENPIKVIKKCAIIK